MTEREKMIIVGNGAREHSVGWQISRFPDNPQLLFASGNAGTAQIGRNLDIESTDIDRIVSTAKDNQAFIFVGPEGPLEKGIVNAAKEAGVVIFGPTQEAALLETRKSRAIEFMECHNIPHPRSAVIKDYDIAVHFFDESIWNDVVIKADGLASGKGVFLPDTKEEALRAIKRIMRDKEFDDGSKLIIQERLRGREVSLLALVDGKTIVPLLPAQDSKRLKDRDKGPNTGGMGAFAPAPMNPELFKQVYNTILRPTVDGMRKEGNMFQGVLYAGLMLTADGPKVLEYNVRFGDPETQVLMMLLKSNLLTALRNTAEGKLSKHDIEFYKGVSVCAVLAAEGYPGKPKTGDVIYGLDKINDPNVQVFQAGTRSKDKLIETAGGRVVTVAAYGNNFSSARKVLYSYIGDNGVNFRGAQVRRDIARKMW
jgi:phosphoribosylamine---glycine ligase